MQRNAFANIVGTTLKTAVVTIVLVANALIWYFYAFEVLMNTVTYAGFASSEVIAVFGINLLGIASAALLSPTLMYRVRRRTRFIFYWMLAGAILSLMPVGINITTFPTLMLFSALVGVYFGLGMPTCLGYFAASTEAVNRSRLGGLTFLFVFLGFFLFVSMGIEDVVLNAMILSLFKIIGLLLLFLLKPGEKQIGQSDRVSYSFIFKNRSFLLYFIPWLMFSVVNYTAVPIVDSIGKVFSDEIANLSPVIENVTAGIFAVVFGFFADFVGRKRLILAGFSLLGVGYACLGLFLGNIYAWWFYTIADGIAWGAFYTIFIMTLWGDLSQEKSSEKYYAIGSLPFLFSNFMRLSISTYVAAISESAVFSFASFFLFLAVLPLIYAPETLPEKKMKERELKKYIEKAKKVKEKAQKKETEKTQRENGDAEVESESEYFKEKLKEAEKYY